MTDRVATGRARPSRMPPDETADPRPNAPILILADVIGTDLRRELVDGCREYLGITERVCSENRAGDDGRPHRRLFQRGWTLGAGDLAARVDAAIRRRVHPAIGAAFLFDVATIERRLVARHAGGAGGAVPARRSNDHPNTSHRHFAVVVNLGTDECRGGDHVFPEYRLIPCQPAPGGAIVYSCSLLYQRTVVTAGVRFTLEPYLCGRTGHSVGIAE